MPLLGYCSSGWLSWTLWDYLYLFKEKSLRAVRKMSYFYFFFFPDFEHMFPHQKTNKKTPKNHCCGGTDQPKSWLVMFILPSPTPTFSPSVQAATVALADPGLIPGALRSMIDMGRTHTHLATNVAPTPYHKDHLTCLD